MIPRTRWLVCIRHWRHDRLAGVGNGNVPCRRFGKESNSAERLRSRSEQSRRRSPRPLKRFIQFVGMDAGGAACGESLGAGAVGEEDAISDGRE